MTRPASGRRWPRITSRRVDLPAPLGPTMPTRSPRMRVRSRSRTRVLSPRRMVTPSNWATRRPERSPLCNWRRALPGASRRAARSARIRSKARTRPSLRVRRARARPGGETAAVQLQDASGQALQEGAVVGDEQQGPAPGLEEALQPVDGLDVQVVGGFVQEEQVGLRDQGTGEEGAPAHAAGEAGGVMASMTRCSRRQPSAASRACCACVSASRADSSPSARRALAAW